MSISLPAVTALASHETLRSSHALTGWIGRRGCSPPEEVPEPVFSHHAFQLLECEERDEGAKDHDAFGKQFIPAFAGELGKAFRQPLAVEQSADRVFQDAE